MKIVIKNKIEDKVREYQKEHGSSKVWMARMLGYKSKQALDGAINSENPTIETLAKFAFFFHCDISELYTLEYYDDRDGKWDKINFDK